MPKPDMTLNVNVQVTGAIDDDGVMTVTKSYTQGATTPASDNVVDSTGDINLGNMDDSNNAYSNRTDITFLLSGTATDPQGHSYPIVFPSSVDSAITIAKHGSGGNGQLVPSLLSFSSLKIDDTDNDGAHYNYCLTVQAQDLNHNGTNPTCRLDPMIVNR